MPFSRVRTSRYSGWLDPDFRPPPELLERPEEAGKLPGAEPLLMCEGRQIYRIPLIYQAVERFCFTYYFKNHSFSRSLRPPHAFQILKMSRGLQEQGFGTLQVLAAVRRRGEWLNWHSFLVALEIPSVLEIPSKGRHLFQIHSVVELSPPLLRSLAAELAQFHDCGLYHGDLKTRHILVQPSGNPRFRFYWVDLEKSSRPRHLPAILRDLLVARDLIQFFSSLQAGGHSSTPSLRPAFLEAYEGTSQRSPQRLRRIRRILDWYGPQGRFRQGETLLASLLRFR